MTFFDARGSAATRPRRDILLSVRDSAATTFHRQFVDGPNVTITTDFHNGPRDAHVVLASLKGHRDAGFMPVFVKKDEPTPLSLMLVPRTPQFVFAPYADVRTGHGALDALFVRTVGNSAAARYEELQAAASSPALACLLNIVEALAVLEVPNQKHPTLVDYIQRLELAPQFQWLRQDRFFAWVDADIEQALEQSTTLFRKAPKVLHPGATSSYKQFGFGEANVQVTLHAQSAGHADGLNLIKAEFDIDYFRSDTAHLLLEVFPNTLNRLVFGPHSSESLTDPAVAFALRWIAVRQPQAPKQARAFAPAFGLTARA